MPLEEVASTFERCIREAGVFERDVPGGSLAETEIVRLENRKWVVIAAGISLEDANSLFPVTGTRAERATKAVNVLGGGQASFLFVIRPFSPADGWSPLAFVTPFLHRGRVPFIEIRQGGYFRLWGHNPGEARLSSFRWELDHVASAQEPIEEWLRPWSRQLGYNPAHAPSHLHLNSPPIPPNSGADSRVEHSHGDLRLAPGLPNPLAMIFSLAAWLRAN
jgi:hypothetical protein